MQMCDYIRSCASAAAEDRVAAREEIDARKAVVGEICGDPEMDADGAATFRAAIDKAAAAVTADTDRIAVSVLYPDWAAGAHTVGEICNADGQTWVCFQAYDNATYPDIQPGSAAWRTFNRPLHGTSPATARPFVQPTGAHDMYCVGEYMIWTDGRTYRCTADTAYSPADYAAAWEVTV